MRFRVIVCLFILLINHVDAQFDSIFIVYPMSSNTLTNKNIATEANTIWPKLKLDNWNLDQQLKPDVASSTLRAVHLLPYSKTFLNNSSVIFDINLGLKIQEDTYLSTLPRCSSCHFLPKAKFIQNIEPFITNSENDKLPIFKNRPLTAALETVSVNLLINRYDAWVANLDWAKVTPENWFNNLHSGFGTDGDTFGTNFFFHPYHGSLFFNAARKNGSSFWGAIPYVLVGSWSWEFLGETYPPSEIDWNTTTLGGVYLGEITHRLSTYLLRNHKRREKRFLRNLGATILNPVGQLNGWLYNDVDQVSRSTNARDFQIRSQFSVGYSRRFQSNKLYTENSYLHINYLLIYGNLFNDQNDFKPFDFFIISTSLDINSLSEYGQNYLSIQSDAPLWKSNKYGNNLFVVSSHYDFIHNNIFKIGAISLTGDYYYNLEADNISLTGGLKFGPILFGSAKSEIVEVIELFNKDDGEFLRDYVYGKGFTFEAVALLKTKDFGRMSLNYNNWLIYIQRDTHGTERNSIFKLDYYYPVWKNLSLGLEYFHYGRVAHYRDYEEFLNIKNGYAEIKLLGAMIF